MADVPRGGGLSDIPEAVPVRRSRLTSQLVWVVPLIAILIGSWIAIKSFLDKGPTVTITFTTAEGIEAGKTKVKYKDVDVGVVKNVTLSPDATHVIVIAQLMKEFEPYLLDDARFWLVQARISGGTVTGLGTLLSGSYIGADIGRSGKPRRDFVGLKQQPAFTSDVPGRLFMLHSDNLGSIDIGSPVFFRRLQAGQVTRYELDDDGKGVAIEVFINSPYDKFVTGNTRFWQASGLDVKLDPTGIRIDTQSIVSILIGGLAFETPIESADQAPAAANVAFRLFPTRNAALKNPEVEVIKWVLVFNESVRGLTVGAPVDFRGIEFGSVTAIRADWSETGRLANIVVEAEIYPARLRAHEDKPVVGNDQQQQHGTFVDDLITSGLRAQLRTGNLLTGQLYIAMDFFPNAPKIKWDSRQAVLRIPTMPSSQSELQSSIASIAAKIEAFPLEQIGVDLRQTLQSATKMTQTATRMMERVDSEITPEAREAIVEARKAIASAQHVLKPDSPLSQDARDAMHEIQRAAAAVRVLADYLDRHPEALLNGKKEEGAENPKAKK